MVTPELLDVLAAWRDFCPHFHLPLQSGAAPVLAAMGRPYGPEEFRDLVREISRRFPGAGLGLDVLVGFPGETAADFEATRSLVADLPVTYLHVFPYSPRPGTPAAELPPLPGNVVQARARIMRELGQAQKERVSRGPTGPGAGSAGGRTGRAGGLAPGPERPLPAGDLPRPADAAQPPGAGALFCPDRGKCWWEKRWASPDTDCFWFPESPIGNEGNIKFGPNA